jgi:hypothetical protein
MEYKVNLCLCLINEALRHEDLWGSGCPGSISGYNHRINHSLHIFLMAAAKFMPTLNENYSRPIITHRNPCSCCIFIISNCAGKQRFFAWIFTCTDVLVASPTTTASYRGHDMSRDAVPSNLENVRPIPTNPFCPVHLYLLHVFYNILCYY